MDAERPVAEARPIARLILQRRTDEPAGDGFEVDAMIALDNTVGLAFGVLVLAAALAVRQGAAGRDDLHAMSLDLLEPDMDVETLVGLTSAELETAALAAVTKVQGRRLRPEVRDAINDNGAEHIGTYAQPFRTAFGAGDGTTIPVVDAIGVLTAAVKALEKRTRKAA